MSDSTDAPSAEILANLQALESRFQEAETQVLKHQTELYAPLYNERDPLLSEIPGFWPTVIGEIQDLEELFNVEDGQLLEHLTSLVVSRKTADPRDFSIAFTFAENDFLDAKSSTVTKEFKHSEDGETEYTSTPVTVHWKKDISAEKQGERPSFWQFFQWTGTENDVFEHGEEVALVLADEVYPDALKLWTSAQEIHEDEDSDVGSVDIQSVDDASKEEEEEEDGDAPKKKKARTE